MRRTKQNLLSTLSLVAFVTLAFGSEESPEEKANREIREAERQAEQAQQDAEKKAAEQAKWDALPETERAFCKILDDFAGQYRAADNDLKKSKLVGDRGKALSAAVPGGRIKDWTATVKTITTTGQGNVVLELTLPCSDFGVGTWNNELSDIMDHTLISRDSPMYDTLAELSVGSTITFGARLVAADRVGFRETSMTELGTMTQSFFVVKF